MHSVAVFIHIFFICKVQA